MAVPEASMNENQSAARWKNDVGFPLKFGTMQPVPVSK
jgi:hypothetical protein